MPTYTASARFQRDYARLSKEHKSAFNAAIAKFVADLASGTFRKGLRVKRVGGAEGIYEMTWAGNGRATFEYGREIKSGEPHVIWRRCGTHEIFGRP